MYGIFAKFGDESAFAAETLNRLLLYPILLHDAKAASAGIVSGVSRFGRIEEMCAGRSVFIRSAAAGRKVKEFLFRCEAVIQFGHGGPFVVVMKKRITAELSEKTPLNSAGGG